MYILARLKIGLSATPSAKRAVHCRTDVTNYDLLEESFSQVVKDFSRIDGL